MRSDSTSRRSRWGLEAALLAGAMLLVFAAVALAVDPEPGGHRGKTGQDRAVSIEVGKHQRIRRFLIFYRAKCDNDRYWESYTVDRDGKGDRIKQENGVFEDEGEYTETGNGFKGKMKVRLSGEFTTPERANGRFRVQIRVTRDGKFVTNCRKATSWKVKHFEDEWPRDPDWTNPRKASARPAGLSGAN